MKTVEQVLRASRMRHRQRRIATSAINLGEMVRECLELARVQYGLNETHLMYTESPEASNARVSGDIDELRAAFANLLDNAVKYSDEEVRVIVSVSAPDEKRVTVRVADQGSGFRKRSSSEFSSGSIACPGGSWRVSKEPGWDCLSLSQS